MNKLKNNQLLFMLALYTKSPSYLLTSIHHDIDITSKDYHKLQRFYLTFFPKLFENLFTFRSVSHCFFFLPKNLSFIALAIGVQL